MNKPTKPNITIPESFAVNGVKADFDNNKILNGFDRIQPDVLAGDNLNKFIDDTYKGLNYSMAASDALNILEDGHTLVYEDGEIKSKLVQSLNDKITNCLLEVPQNIKLELNDGTLTLKAGSKVIVPNGVGVFDEVVIESDINVSAEISGTHSRLVYYNVTGNKLDCLASHFSGTTAPTSTINHFWYDITNNKVKLYYSGAYVDSVISLPIALVTAGNGQMFNSLDQVFNGFGYIGNTAWVDKGVKVLIPDGRNVDGSLKNIERTLEKVCITSSSSAITNGVFVLTPNSINNGASHLVDYNTYTFGEEEPTTQRWYKPSANMFYIKRDGAWYEDKQVFVGVFTKTTSSITSFEPKLPFRAVDYNDAVLKADMSEVIAITEAYSNGTSGYIVYSNGYCEQWGQITATGSYTTVTLLKAYKDTNYWCISNCQNKDTGEGKTHYLYAGILTTNTIEVGAWTSGYKCRWMTKGYIL